MGKAGSHLRHIFAIQSFDVAYFLDSEGRKLTGHRPGVMFRVTATYSKKDKR